jgi:TnpA family transposase
MRTLQVGENPTRLAQGIAEFGRIDKTLHSLRFIDDKDMRRGTLTQLNRGEGGLSGVTEQKRQLSVVSRIMQRA